MRRVRLTSLAALLATGLTLSGCAAVDGVVGDVTALFGQDETSSEATMEENTPDDTASTGSTEVEEQEQAETEAPSVEAAVPACADMYSDAQRVAFESEGRQPEGDRSGDGYNYGTTNQDLITLLAAVRDDLSVSCTWYLPPEFGSTTSIAVMASERAGEVETVLTDVADSSTALGTGTLWKFDSSSSNISGEYIANESHFIAPIDCPQSLAETDCSVWITSTNSAGSSEELTRDAAETYGILN